MGKPSAPAAPDPKVVANANFEEGSKLSAFNAAMTPNILTPYGSQTRVRTGTDPNTGAPLYTDTLSLSPTAQKTIDQNIQNSYDVSKAGSAFLKNAQNTLNNPVNVSDLNYQTNIGTGDNNRYTQQAQDAIYAKQTALLDPQYQQAKQALETRLANQGINLGSAAYDREMNNFARQRDYAYGNARNDAITQGLDYGNLLFGQDTTKQQGFNNAISAELNKRFAQNNQALNQYTALTSGSQVSTPQFQSQPIQSVNPTNMTELYNNKYKQQLANYNAGVAGNNSLLGGLFGLGGAVLGAPATSTFGRLLGI